MPANVVAKKDRRGRNRLHTPVCPHCRTTARMLVTLRSLSHIHFRCIKCGEMVAEPNPAQTPNGRARR